MPAVSEKQARFARFCEHADHPGKACPKRGTLTHFQHTAKKPGESAGCSSIQPINRSMRQRSSTPHDDSGGVHERRR